MKHYIYSVLITMITLTSCSIESDNNSETNIPEIIRIEWHLTNVTGGVSGLSNDFELNDIIWTFNEEYGALSVSNNNSDNTLEDGLDSGTYSFEITIQDNEEFLLVNDNEYGLLTIYPSDNEMTIDQNITMSGDAADGYLYTFRRVIIYEE